MLDPKAYLRIAVDAGVIANDVRPGPGDQEYADLRNLVVYHLRTAQTHLRKLAEALAGKQGMPKT